MISSVLKNLSSKRFNIRYLLNGTACDLDTKFRNSNESIVNFNNSTISKSEIYVKNNSCIALGKNCLIQNCKIYVNDNSKLTLGDNCKLIDSIIILRNQSQLSAKDYWLLKSEKPYYEAVIKISSGSALFGSNSNIKGKIFIDNGHLSMGSNNFLNYGSEIRCENSISIGDYVLISYFVDIFDTNTHSVDWEDRKKEIDDGFPNSSIRSVSPMTSPIIIGSNVWIGKYAAVLKGSLIGAKSIVGTRSVVTKSFAEESLICGNPAILTRKIR